MKKIFAILVCALVSCTNSEEAIKAYTETVNSNPTLEGHKMLHVVGQTDL